MPNIGVNVVVFKSNEILLIKREDFEIWALPSGAVDEGESVAQAALRETLEETGIEAKLTRLVGVYSRSGLDKVLHSITFAAEPIGGRLKPQPGETVDVNYFPVDALPEPFFGLHRQRVQDAANGIGGGVAWSQKMLMIGGNPQNRQEVYELRDRSGMPPAQFFEENVLLVEERLEVSG